VDVRGGGPGTRRNRECPNSFFASFTSGKRAIHSYERTMDFLEYSLLMGVVVAGGVGYFLIQHEVLTAIFFGFPPTLLSSARFG
jgi:hypothetical protein